MQAFDDKIGLTPMILMFLELDTHYCYMYFRLLDENNNAIVPKKF